MARSSRRPSTLALSGGGTVTTKRKPVRRVRASARDDDKASGNGTGPAGAAQADFLAQLRPGGPWLLVAIDPDTETITAITAQQQADVTGFVQHWNGKRNLYYMVNPIRQALDKKPAKTDVAGIEYLLADLDPAADETPAAAKARYRAQLETMQPTPT